MLLKAAPAGPVDVAALRSAALDAVRRAAPADLPALAGLGEELRVSALARLQAPPAPAAVAPQADTGGALITAPEAARIAAVDVDAIYRWARRSGVRWARRLSRRCFRVDEARFRTWLAVGGGRP